MKLFRRVRIKTEIRVDGRRSDYSILVDNLGPEVNEYVLVSFFQTRFPSYKSAKIMTDPISGISDGYGFVRFADKSDQLRAFTEMQGVYCGNHPMRIETYQIGEDEWKLVEKREQETKDNLAGQNYRNIRRQMESAADEDDPDAEEELRHRLEAEAEEDRLEAEAELDDELQREAAVEEELNNRILEEELAFYDSEEDSDEPGNKYGPKARRKREEELKRMMMEDDGEEDEAMDISDDD